MREHKAQTETGLLPRLRRRATVRSLLAVGVVAVAAACGSSSTSPSSSSGKVGGSITVWVDSVRLPAAQAYAAAHPNIKVHIVSFDGDSNGATGLQTKVNLWNRENSGWPDVIFSEQVNDPVWMAQAPFNFAEPISGLIPQSVTSQWPAPSLAQCTVKGQLICLQDNLAQDVLYVNQKLMTQFGYQTPTTWQEWQQLGLKVAAEHPGYIVGDIGESFSHWIYLWANQCPLESLQSNGKLLINTSDVHCTEMASLLDPLISDGALALPSVFTPDFAKKYGGADDKVLMMPGPTWYALSVFQQTLHIPSGQMTAASPLSWNGQTPVTTGQVGGGPWIIAKHSQNLATAADFVTWVTTVFNPPSGPNVRAGYPAYKPLATAWLAQLATNTYFASDPTPPMVAAATQIWTGWSIVTYPDQPVWSNTVVTALVQKHSLSSLLPAFGTALSQTATAAGYQVINSP